MIRPRVLLAASILLNLFLAGVVVGGLWWVEARQLGMAGGALRLAGAELPTAERKALRDAIREGRHSVRPSIREGRAARREAATALAAAQPNRAAFLRALGKARAADFVVRAATETRAAVVVLALPAAERTRVAEAMVRRGGRQRR